MLNNMTNKKYRKLCNKAMKKRYKRDIYKRSFDDRIFTTLKTLANIDFNPYDLFLDAMGMLPPKEKYYYRKMELLTKLNYI